ncbi:MAG TPA: hypothetical protein VF266_19615 [Thermoanaerobaculia bacterium]
MSRRLAAWGLTLALMAVIAAAVIPSCDSLCCARDGGTAVQAQMPCCEPSISQGDFPQQPLKVEDRQSCLSVVALPEGQTGLSVLHLATARQVRRAEARPTPPLFLLNAQFLI